MSFGVGKNGTFLEKINIFAIVDDYSKFICTLSLKSKVETLQMFTNFAKKN